MKCPECGKQEPDGFLFCKSCHASLPSESEADQLGQQYEQSQPAVTTKNQGDLQQNNQNSYSPAPTVQRQPLPPAEKHVPHPPTYTQNNESQIRIPRTPVGLIIAAFVLWLFCLVAVVGVLFRLSESMLLSFGDYIWCFVWGIPAFIITMNAKKKISIINEMRDNYERKRRGR